MSFLPSFRSKNRKTLPQRHRSPIIIPDNNGSRLKFKFLKASFLFSIALCAYSYTCINTKVLPTVTPPAPPTRRTLHSDDTDVEPPQTADHPIDDTNPKLTVGYAISITGCPKDGSTTLIDGAAVLRHSIHLNSVRASPSSRYDYRMYAIVHPEASHCAHTLRQIGYEILLRDIPVPLDEIQGDNLRERLPKNGCCGEKEYIKLWAYSLVQHPVIVHLDVDTVLLRPMDVLFDTMLQPPPASSARGTLRAIDAMWPDRPLPPVISAYFTRDYNMVKPSKPHVGVQGGFLVLRPSLDALALYTDTIRTGDFRREGGWGGTEHGTFYGGMTFQGIVPYFYDELRPGTAVELNRCVWNQMADNPRVGRTINDVVSGLCRDGREECEDCRERGVGEVKSAHFTLCQKPWECLGHTMDRLQDRLCRKMHGEWFRIREDMERGLKGGEQEGKEDVGMGDGNYDREHFRGFCNGGGSKGYIPMKLAAATVS